MTSDDRGEGGVYKNRTDSDGGKGRGFKSVGRPKKIDEASIKKIVRHSKIYICHISDMNMKLFYLSDLISSINRFFLTPVNVKIWHEFTFEIVLENIQKY